MPKISVPEVTDPLKNSGPPPDFKADSQALLDKFEADCAAEEGREPEYVPEPDLNLEMGNTGQVSWIITDHLYVM